MYDFLIDHALKNVWCSPNQDKQSIVKPVRLTPAGGSWNYVQVLWDKISLPVKNKRFHVYQVGQLHPYLLGLFPSYLKWETMASNCNKQTMIVDVYDVSGLQYPRVEVWYMVTKNKNLIIAVKEPEVDTIPVDFLKAEIYLRVYTNAYFNTERAALNGRVVHVSGKRLLSTQDLTELRNEYISYLSEVGAVYCFVNGYKVDAIDLLNCKVGDIAEFVYDSSIKAIYDFSIEELKTFVSTLDTTRKYLLHYEGVTDIIDYQDDIDLFLIKENNNKHKGVYLHKNQEHVFRMVTHKDYSLDVDITNSFLSYQEDWSDLRDLTVRMHIRNSGYDRPLVFENNRIHELYKLNDDDLVGAMLGIDSTVDVFKAESLENSEYTAIMRSVSSCLPKEQVLDAYGFNATSKILADTPVFPRIESSQLVADVPYGLVEDSTGYEYDQNGELISWYDHVGGTIYSIRNPGTKLLEQITGKSSKQIEEYYNQSTVTLKPGVDYRFYTCPLFNGVATGQWEDVTGSAKYAIIDGEVTWLTNPLTTYTLIRGDSINLAYSIDIGLTNGALEFSLTQTVFREGQTVDQVMEIPMGFLDVMLNNKSIIEDLDYFVQFPKIVITNKEYLIDPENSQQKITVRFSGHPNSDFTRDKRWDTGFIDHGLLSSNNRFDLRDDKVIRIVVDGALYERTELEYAETDPGVTVPDARNGAPYLIRDIVPGIKAFTGVNTYDYRDEALLIDKAVSDYLTLKLPQPEPTNPNVIPGIYQIYSPFLSRITMDLVDGILDDPRIKEHYNDSELDDILSDYLYLLPFDPTQPNNKTDERYVIVQPHYSVNVVDVNIYQFKLLDRANKFYCGNTVILSHFYRIVGYGV